MTIENIGSLRAEDFFDRPMEEFKLRKTPINMALNNITIGPDLFSSVNGPSILDRKVMVRPIGSKRAEIIQTFMNERNSLKRSSNESEVQSVKRVHFDPSLSSSTEIEENIMNKVRNTDNIDTSTSLGKPSQNSSSVRPDSSTSVSRNVQEYHLPSQQNTHIRSEVQAEVTLTPQPKAISSKSVDSLNLAARGIRRNTLPSKINPNKQTENSGFVPKDRKRRSSIEWWDEKRQRDRGRSPQKNQIIRRSSIYESKSTEVQRHAGPSTVGGLSNHSSEEHSTFKRSIESYLLPTNYINTNESNPQNNNSTTGSSLKPTIEQYQNIHVGNAPAASSLQIENSIAQENLDLSMKSTEHETVSDKTAETIGELEKNEGQSVVIFINKNSKIVHSSILDSSGILVQNTNPAAIIVNSNFENFENSSYVAHDPTILAPTLKAENEFPVGNSQLNMNTNLSEGPATSITIKSSNEPNNILKAEDSVNISSPKVSMPSTPMRPTTAGKQLSDVARVLLTPAGNISSNSDSEQESMEIDFEPNLKAHQTTGGKTLPKQMFETNLLFEKSKTSNLKSVINFSDSDSDEEEMPMWEKRAEIKSNIDNVSTKKDAMQRYEELRRKDAEKIARLENSKKKSAAPGKPWVVGQQISRIKLQNEKGRVIDLLDISQEDGVVIFIFLKAAMSGCQFQACNYKHLWDEFNEQGYQVYGCSPDPPAELNNLRMKEKLNFELLSDPNLELCKACSVVEPGAKIIRSHVIIGEGGILQHIQRKIQPKVCAKKALEFISELDEND